MSDLRIWAVLIVVAGTFCCEAEGHADIHEMIENVNRQIIDHPESAPLYLRRSKLHSSHREFEKALADLMKAEELDATAAPYPFLRAEILFNSGALEKSLLQLDGWLEIHPEDPEGWILRARILGAQEKYQEAAAAWKKGMGLHPKPTPDLVDEQMNAHLKCDDPVAALQAVEDGLNRLGPIPSLQLLAVELELELEQFNQALDRINGMINNASSPGGYYFLRARVLESAGRSAEAQKDWKKGLEWLDRLPPGAQQLPSNIELRRQATEALQAASEKMPTENSG